MTPEQLEQNFTKFLELKENYRQISRQYWAEIEPIKKKYQSQLEAVTAKIKLLMKEL